MTISNLVKITSTIAILGLATQVQAAGDMDHDHGAMMATPASTTMNHDNMSATPTPVMAHDMSGTPTPVMNHDHVMPVTTATESNDPQFQEKLTQYVKEGKISGGVGINYTGKFIFDKQMTKFDMAKGLFGTDLSVINQANGFPGFAGDSHEKEAITIPALRSMSWNNPQSNPDGVVTTDLAKGFGSGGHSQWYLVDLSKLSSGKYYVSIKLERYNDGQAVEVVPASATAAEQTLPSDDDLVPALTVFDGYQNRGISGSWYPNQFQETKTPFWAEMLKPEKTLLGSNTKQAGFDTAFGSVDADTAHVSGTIKLDAAGKLAQTNRYLTVAIGGDDRNAQNKHEVNYKLTVKVHSCVGAPCAKN